MSADNQYTNSPQTDNNPIPDDLSPTMCDALDYARSLRAESITQRGLRGHDLGGWFYAQFTTRGSIDFFCRPQTLEALFRRGLLERRIRYFGDGTEFKEYRAPAEPPPDSLIGGAR